MSLSTKDYEYFTNEVFGNTASTYEECFEEGIMYGWNEAKTHYTNQFRTEIKKRLSKKDWDKIKQLFD